MAMTVDDVACNTVPAAKARTTSTRMYFVHDVIHPD